MKIKNTLLTLSLGLLMVACSSTPSVQPTWHTAGGSRADAIVRLSYDKTGHLNASDAQGLALAKKRCASRGYQSAEAFDYHKTTCLQYGKKRCRIWRIEREYQCTRSQQDAQQHNNTSAPININLNVLPQNSTERTLKPI